MPTDVNVLARMRTCDLTQCCLSLDTEERNLSGDAGLYAVFNLSNPEREAFTIIVTSVLCDFSGSIFVDDAVLIYHRAEISTSIADFTSAAVA
jgi:hypothetical protein